MAKKICSKLEKKLENNNENFILETINLNTNNNNIKIQKQNQNNDNSKTKSN